MNRLMVLSEIGRDIAQVFFASIVIGPIMSGAFKIETLIAGISLTIVSKYIF